MMNRDIFLFLVLFFYTFPIFLICKNYKCNNSVSNIICDKQCKFNILFFMFLMAISTVLYELNRNDVYSQLFIFTILISIGFLIVFDESYMIHYFFAGTVFLSIMFFMIHHTILTKNIFLLLSLILAIILLLFIIFNLQVNFFYTEVIYILNFAFYYVYLHFITRHI